MNIWIMVFSVITQCSFVRVYQHLGETLKMETICTSEMFVS